MPFVYGAIAMSLFGLVVGIVDASVPAFLVSLGGLLLELAIVWLSHRSRW